MAEESVTATDRRHRLVDDWWCLAIVALALVVPVWGLMRSAGPPMEEGFMLAFPEQILRGSFPNGDFLHLYGPGSLYLLAAVYKVFGTHLEVERTVGLAQHAVVAFSLFALLRPWGRRIATAGSVVSVIILMGATGLTALAWNGSLALGLSAIAVAAAAIRRVHDANGPGIDRVAGRLAVGAGVLGGLALLWRPDAVLAVGLGLGAAAVALDRSRRLRLLIGAGATLLLYVPHVLISGLGDSIEGMFIEPVFKLRAGRSLPVPPSWGSIDGFLQRVGAIDREMADSGTRNVPADLRLVLVGARIDLPWCSWPPGGSAAPCPVPDGHLVLARRIVLGRSPAPGPPTSRHRTPRLGVGRVVPLVHRRRGLPDRAVAPVVATVARPVERPRPVAVVIVVLIPTFPLRSYLDASRQNIGIGRSSYPIENDGRRFYYGNEQAAGDAQRISTRSTRSPSPVND